MPYIIDGHNLIPKVPGLSLSTLNDEEMLIKQLQSFCRQTRKSVEVYFDNAPAGQPRKRKFGFVTAFFIRQGTTADSAIRTRLRKLKKEAKNWSVVSSDRAVAAAAHEAHATVISSDAFVRTLSSTLNSTDSTSEKDEDISLSPDDIEDWLKLFSNRPTEE